MTTEIERLAQALVSGLPSPVRRVIAQDECADAVRAILQSLREPSEGMILNAPPPFEFKDFPGAPTQVFGTPAKDVWQAMIDHLLNEPQ
jgi:hypothetical protein